MIGTTARHLSGATLAVALLAGCGAQTTAGTGTAASPPAPSVTGSSAAPTTSAATAYLLETPEFSVGFPEEPMEQTQDIPEVPGLTALTYSVNLGPYSVVLGLVDYPADVELGEPVAVLEGARDGAVSRVPEGRIISSTPRTVDGRPALDVVATAVDNGSYRSLIVLDDRRLYQLITAGAADRQAEHDEFAASLRLRP